jgi:hypothetical protein
MVVFIDGDKACTPLAVPDQLLAMMDDVATAKIRHEGNRAPTDWARHGI